jgi:HTH-type transcriptional regulator / antitoxin HigA
MSEEKDFQPDWVSPPGETIAEILEQKNLSPIKFAERIGRTSEEVEELIRGAENITIETARKLQNILGASVAFWMIRESQYREDQVRLANNILPGSTERWLAELPLRDMEKFGWIKSVSGSGSLMECLRFFGLPDFQAWREKYIGMLQQAAFKTSRAFPANPSATAAWLRQAEIEAESISCEPWSAERFTQTLAEIRQLTRKKDPNIFTPELRRQCAKCGVAVVILRAPAGCRASGATRFLSSEKALLLLSFRYLSDDHFWFTFFHEAGHLLLHNQKALFLEGHDVPAAKEEEEEEANKFAADILIPARFRKEMLNLPVNGFVIMRFAKVVGVSPGIVVGQLQYHGRFTHRQLNNLKRRFIWKPNEGGAL